MIRRGIVVLLFWPIALILGALPKRLFVPREVEDDRETWIAVGTAHIDYL